MFEKSQVRSICTLIRWRYIPVKLTPPEMLFNAA